MYVDAPGGPKAGHRELNFPSAPQLLKAGSAVLFDHFYGALMANRVTSCQGVGVGNGLSL